MSLQKHTILIVDDQPANIQILANALEPFYDVMVAASGQDALEILMRPDRADLVLLDVMMPGMDGYEVCRRIKDCEATKNIPVVFVTSRTESSEEEIGLNLGAVDYISKPYRLPIILARVRNHLAMKRKTDLLESLVSLDGLTGIPNRRKFDELLDYEWRRAVRSSRPLSIVMMDIDHFKQFNDHYGHGAGDDCLLKVANCLMSCVKRPGDLIARYGGEEFVALLPLTDAEGAQAVSSGFVAAISALKLPHLYSETADHVTISAGCAVVVPDQLLSKQSLLQKADEMLYHAKSQGRNRVSVSDICESVS